MDTSVNNRTEEGEPVSREISSAERAVARQIWLHYYNDYLREREVITEAEWHKMRRLIDRKPPHKEMKEVGER